MVQVIDAQIIQKKAGLVRVRGGKVKTSAKSPDKVATSFSSIAVQYASLPGRFKVRARGSSILVAQARKARRPRKSTRCIPGIAKIPPRKRARRLTSSIKIGKKAVKSYLQLRADGVDAFLKLGNKYQRVPLDVKATWDAKKRKVIIDGKVLKSSKLISTPSGIRLHYDEMELGRLVRPQMDALFHDMNDKGTERRFMGLGKALKSLDGKLAKLKKISSRLFKANKDVQGLRKDLIKIHERLKAHLLEVIKRGRKIARLKRGKGFTKSFRKKLKSLKRQNAKLRGWLITLKSKVWKIIYKYWLRGKKVRKRPC